MSSSNTNQQNKNDKEAEQQSPPTTSPISAAVASPIITSDSHDPLTKAWEALRESFHTRNWIWFCILGFINNYHYCVVISGAEAVAESFHLKSLMALISWANIAGGIFVRFLNAFVLMHWSYNKKYLAAGCQTLFGITVVCLAPFMGTSDGFRFFLTLFGIVFIGTGSSFGEQSSLGYLDHFPSRTIGGFSSGTGLSGVIGALVYLGLQNANLNESSIFAIQLPFVLVYWCAYYFGIILVPRKEVKLLDDEQYDSTSVVENNNNNNNVSFKKLMNYERNWQDEHALGSASSSTSTNSGHSLQDLGSSNNKNEDGSNNNKKFGERENVPLLNEDANEQQEQSNDANETHSPKENDDQKEKENEENDEDNLNQDPSPLTPAGENPEWGAFRRWIFRVAPVFPAEAIVECNRLILFQGINLFLVYVFEYSIQFVAPDCFPDFSKKSSSNDIPSNTTTTTMIPTTFVNMSTAIPTDAPQTCSPSSDFDFMTRNAYVISQFCYQFGVLISRSSLSVVRIQRVELLTLFQFINFVCWLVLAKTGWLLDSCDPHRQLHFTIIMMIWMILVGLQGGASYVNVFFNILNDADLQEKLGLIAKGELKRQKDRKRREEKRLGAEQPQLNPFKLNARELTMNVSALYQTLGITIGSLLDVVLNNTLIKK